MKLLFFDDYKFGVLKGDNVVDCSDVVAGIPHLEPQHILKGVIENFGEYRPKLEQAVAQRDGVQRHGPEAGGGKDLDDGLAEERREVEAALAAGLRVRVQERQRARVIAGRLPYL